MSKQINGFMVASLTAVQAAIINGARTNSSNDERKQIKREVFSVVKDKFGIDQSIRVRANTTGASQPGYLVLHVGGKRSRDAGKAFQLGDDGRYNGTLLTKDQLFPPAPAPASSPAATAASGSVFGGAVGGWFRLDPTQVALALTVADLEDQDFNHVTADTAGNGQLPSPHLFLAGRQDLAITEDGSIYRKQ